MLKIWGVQKVDPGYRGSKSKSIKTKVSYSLVTIHFTSQFCYVQIHVTFELLRI